MGNALTQTWDKDHMYDEAKASGREFYLMGYNLVNGPVAGPLGRTPCEYYAVSYTSEAAS